MTTPEADSKKLIGPKVLLMGDSGSGKTYSIGTLVDWAQANEFRVAVLFTESSTETLLGYWRDGGKPIPPCLYWHQSLTKPLSLSRLIDAAQKVGQMSYEAVTKIQDMTRSGENNAFWKILGDCAKFIDDRTGQDLGAVDSWDLKTIFVIDSLTELSNAAMKMQIGNKPTAAPPDYGVAQNNLINFIRLITQGIPCPVVLTAHVDRNTDEISGSSKIMVKSIGKALYNDIPPLFSDVIYCTREGTNWYWDTNAYGVTSKTRSLGYRSKITPDFAQIMNVWAKRSGM